ncbi:MAG: RecX family transcriptional regulator [Clostridia bacterium]|nr:RecX family transcriptional regulator [Clostridia bacterium]
MELPKELSSCYHKALYRLSMGDMTTLEMTDYLSDPKRKNTGFSPEIAQRVVAILVEEGFLDDKRYLRLAVAKLDRALAGPRRIREHLTRHRFPTRFVEAALSRSIDYESRALRLLEKRKGAEELALTPQGRKKLTDYLVRQGYDYGTARGAMAKFSDGEDLDSD